MSKANRAASRMSLGSSALDGYNGPLDIMTRHRSWWRRLLRMRGTVVYTRVYGDVRADSARVWRNR